MGILKGIIKTAKELYEADSNNQLGDYLGGKISGVVSKFDGSEQEELEAAKTADFEFICNELDSEAFDNQMLQDEVDKYLERYQLTSLEQQLAYYVKAVGWDKVIDSIGELRQEEGYFSKSEEEKQADNSKEREAHLECMSCVKKAIDLMDVDSFELMACKLYTLYSERLHWEGNRVEAVRWAIQALPYACDEDERARAKWAITGKKGEYDNRVFVAPNAGYGFDGRTIKERIEFVKELCELDISQYDSWELLEGDLDFFAQETVSEFMSVKHAPDTFSNRPYHDRQFIFTVRDLDHIGGCYDETDNIKYVLPLDELPGEITFPVGHPQPNTLYYAHPLRPYYLPFENAQLLLFYEKIQEMCRLFQCLGAIQITARCLKGQKVSSDVVSARNLDVEGGYKVVSGSLGVSGRHSTKDNSETRNEMQLTQTFSPQKAPYCPKDLLWAKNDPELQTLIQQRLEGSLLNFTKKVSSFETSSLSQNQVIDVKVAFQSLMANVSTNYSTSTDTTFSSTSETEWEISVEFKPLNEFAEFVPEKKHEWSREDLLIDNAMFAYIKGGGIVFLGTLEKDVKKGDKVIVSNGTSEYESTITGVFMFMVILDQGEKGDKAGLFLDKVIDEELDSGMRIYMPKQDGKSTPTESTASVSKSDNHNLLTPEEEKYKEEILFCLEEDGVITDDDRKYLERKRKRLGITEERAQEIEQSTAPSLSDDEKEYMETYKELSANGELTERAKKLLNRERESLNISQERAEQIEKLCQTK